jgi:hypothetical protein
MAKGTSTILFLIIGLAIGFLIGWLVFGEITQTGEARVAIGAIGNSTTGKSAANSNPGYTQIDNIEKPTNNTIPIYVIRQLPNTNELQCLGHNKNWEKLDITTINELNNKLHSNLCKNILDTTDIDTGSIVTNNGTQTR